LAEALLHRERVFPVPAAGINGPIAFFTPSWNPVRRRIP
jgi:hypothetical protein